MYMPQRNRVTDAENKLVVTKRERGKLGVDNVLCIKQISNKDALCTIENCRYYLVITFNGYNLQKY